MKISYNKHFVRDNNEISLHVIGTVLSIILGT